MYQHALNSFEPWLILKYAFAKYTLERIFSFDKEYLGIEIYCLVFSLPGDDMQAKHWLFHTKYA